MDDEGLAVQEVSPSYQLTTDETEVQRGYKQTEVGMIPEDWGVISIDQIANIYVGKDLNEACFSLDKDDNYKFPVYSNTVDNFGFYGYYNYSEYSGESLTIVGRGVGLGTAFSRTGAYGAIGRLLVLFPKNKWSTSFVASYFNHKISVFHESSGIPQLTGIGLAKYKIVFPPLKEQKAITQALSDVDALIASLDKLIAKKHAIKTATMQQLLTGKKRLPGFGKGKGYKETEIGVIPVDWTPPKVGDICTLINGRGFKPHEWESEGLPIIRIQNLNGSDEFNYFSGAFNPKILVKNHQLLFAWSGSRGTSFGPHIWRGGDALLNYHTWKIVIDYEKVDHGFFFHALKALTVQIEDKAHGASALVHTQKGEMEQFLIPMPITKEEQHAIAQVLSDIDSEITALESRLHKTQSIKQGMMQELLTGKIRLI